MTDLTTTFQTILERTLEVYKPLRRNRGLPYVTHPLEVMSGTKSMPERILALIHDYGEFRDLTELAQYGVPEDLISRARMLTKTFPDDIKEDDPRYREYIWNLLGDALCRKVKHSDLNTNGGFEESPVGRESHTSGEYPHVLALMADAAKDKLYFMSKSFMVNVFSNFYPAEITIDGEVWKSAEHFYQAAKFSKKHGVSGETGVYEAIRRAETAGQAKQIADEYFTPDNRVIWNQALRRYAAIYLMLNAKFAPGTEARKLLQKTGDLELIHESQDDMFWGQNRKGKGANVLGKTLMQMRDENGNSSILELMDLAYKAGL